MATPGKYYKAKRLRPESVIGIRVHSKRACRVHNHETDDDDGDSLKDPKHVWADYVR
jgi:hypothetical protein